VAARIYAECVKPLPIEDLEHVLRQTRPLWERVRGQRLFLTGGTGFFGAWLLESLGFSNRELELDLSATVLSRNPEAFLRRMPHLAAEKSIRFIRGSIVDFDLPGERFDQIIHAATPSSGDEAREPDLSARMIAGTERVLAFARAAGAQRFLFTSSGDVYGPQRETESRLSESIAAKPVTPYGQAKLRCEEMCAECAQTADIRFAVARCFAFVGPHLPLDRHFAIGNFIGDALAGRKIRIAGDGTPVRSYLYAADLAIWLWTLLLRPADAEPKVQTCNVGSDEAITIGELARTVVEELDPSLEFEIAREAVGGGPRSRYVPDVSKAEAELGVRPTIGLREAIRRTADWHRLGAG
jgi:nucleoside-diphosphate-sugar epimerase